MFFAALEGTDGSLGPRVDDEANILSKYFRGTLCLSDETNINREILEKRTLFDELSAQGEGELPNKLNTGAYRPIRLPYCR